MERNHMHLSDESTFKRGFLFKSCIYLTFIFDVTLKTKIPKTDFNIAHFDWIETLLPFSNTENVIMLIVFSGIFALFIKKIYPLADVVFAVSCCYFYFSSMKDMFQHHYLVTQLIIALAWLSPNKERLWTVKLCAILMSVVYVYTAITKMTHVSISGKVFILQNLNKRVLDTVSYISYNILNIEEVYIWYSIGLGAVVLELAIACGLFFGSVYGSRLISSVTFFIGISFHLFIQYLGYNIGWFILYLAEFYIFLYAPDIIIDIIPWKSK